MSPLVLALLLGATPFPANVRELLAYSEKQRPTAVESARKEYKALKDQPATDEKQQAAAKRLADLENGKTIIGPPLIGSKLRRGQIGTLREIIIGQIPNSTEAACALSEVDDDYVDVTSLEEAMSLPKGKIIKPAGKEPTRQTPIILRGIDAHDAKPNRLQVGSFGNQLFEVTGTVNRKFQGKPRDLFVIEPFDPTPYLSVAYGWSV